MFFNINKIKNILKNQNDGLSFADLCQKMNVNFYNRKSFSKFLNSLFNKQEIFISKSNFYFIPKDVQEHTGKIEIHFQGFAFVKVNSSSQDNNSLVVFLPKYATKNAIDQDEVVIKYFVEPSHSQDHPLFQGYVFKIEKRFKKELIGMISKKNNKLNFIPYNEKFLNYNFLIKTQLIDSHQLENNIVIAKIIKYGDTTLNLEVKEKIGHYQDIGMDILQIIYDEGIPYHFPKEVLEEAQKIPEKINVNFDNRKDLRKELVITIDGEDTKDFDDAISISKLNNNNYLLKVHIADVSYYVKQDSLLDNEAYQRGTSIYLVDRVVPMLPPKICNGICSLNPHVDRYTLTCQMEIDDKGNTISYDIFPSVINSKYRLTYKDVNSYFNNQKTWNNHKLHQMLDLAYDLSAKISEYKQKQGYINFDIHDTKIVLDKFGKTKDVLMKESGLSQQIIENFMVRANETIAFFIQKQKLPFLYRVHNKPTSEKLFDLQKVLNHLNINVNCQNADQPVKFAQQLKEIKKNRFDDFIKILLLKTMSKAIYHEENIGHFGLGSKFYTHFTSPIRRYSDLLVHRMLYKYYFQKNSHKKNFFLQQMNVKLSAIAKNCSSTSERAVNLERRVNNIKKAEFYKKFVGKSLNGTIVSILKFGFFVEFTNKVSGLVHIKNFINENDDEFQVVDNLYIKTKNKKFDIGQKVQVNVLSVNQKNGTIDLILTDHYNQFKKNSIKNSLNI